MSINGYSINFVRGWYKVVHYGRDAIMWAPTMKRALELTCIR